MTQYVHKGSTTMILNGRTENGNRSNYTVSFSSHEHHLLKLVTGSLLTPTCDQITCIPSFYFFFFFFIFYHFNVSRLDVFSATMSLGFFYQTNIRVRNIHRPTSIWILFFKNTNLTPRTYNVIKESI